MTDVDPAYQFEAKIQRWTGTDDRDTFKAKLSAESIDELDDKVSEIHPQKGSDLSDDQATLDGSGSP